MLLEEYSLVIGKPKIIGISIITLSLLIPISIKQTKTETIKAKTKSYIQKTPQVNINQTDEYNYIAVLEIPQINLKQGLVSPNSKYNDVDYNIKILDTSMMPDTINSNLIIAAHSGNSQVSFFKNLNKLRLNDEIYLYYENNKYHYKVDKTYEVNKTGWINIIRNRDKTTITLITCKPNDDKKQLVYIAYLIDKINY